MVHRADLSRDESNRDYGDGLHDLTSEHLFYIITMQAPGKKTG